MPASAGTHIYGKRDLPIQPGLIAGIVGIVVVFNLILVVSWCILRDRRKPKAPHKRRISAPIDCEKYEESVAFAIATGAVPAPDPIEGRSYYALLQALQRHPDPTAPADKFTHSRESSRTSVGPPGLKKLILRPQDLKDSIVAPRSQRRYSRSQRKSTTLQVPIPPGLMRSNSLAETASVYSSASAPMDYHDRLVRSQPFVALAPSSAPAWISEIPKSEIPKPPSRAILSKASSADFDQAFPMPTPNTPNSTLKSLALRPSSSPPPASSPISVPTSSTLSAPRARASSGPSKVRWLTQPIAAVSAHRKRPNSTSSLSTIVSAREAARTEAAVATIAPLDVRRASSHRAHWASVDLTRSTPLPLSSAGPPRPPAIPARSPMRPLPSASVERLCA